MYKGCAWFKTALQKKPHFIQSWAAHKPHLNIEATAWKWQPNVVYSELNPAAFFMSHALCIPMFFFKSILRHLQFMQSNSGQLIHCHSLFTDLTKVKLRQCQPPKLTFTQTPRLLRPHCTNWQPQEGKATFESCLFSWFWHQTKTGNAFPSLSDVLK